MAAMTFVDDLAVVGTNVGEIAAILEADELERPKEIAELKGNGIELHQVEFSDGERDGRSAAWHQSFHSAGNSQCIGRAIRFRKINTCKTDCRFLERNRRKYHIGRNGYLRKIPFEQLNGQIAYVSQENYLFDRSIRDNIRMGNPNATDEEVEEAARQSGCDSFIRALDNGYDTVAGGGGGHLSGGEKQRISYCKSHVKKCTDCYSG